MYFANYLTQHLYCLKTMTERQENDYKNLFSQVFVDIYCPISCFILYSNLGIYYKEPALSNCCDSFQRNTSNKDFERSGWNNRTFGIVCIYRYPLFEHTCMPIKSVQFTVMSLVFCQCCDIILTWNDSFQARQGLRLMGNLC